MQDPDTITNLLPDVPTTDMDLEGLRNGNRRSVARAISLVENDPAQAQKFLQEIFPHTGEAGIVGITGPAGAGKSSLINQLTMRLSKTGRRPAVLAVDPTSHITGGAILGDRVRMTESTDSGVYIRSLASRGATGAVSGSLRNSIRVLEYARFEPIIVESVGAGQTEVDISDMADVTVVVFNPHTGDSIQTIKAGITEIGDICVVNKSDLPGSAALFDAVRDFIGESDRNPQVILTSVKNNEGIDELSDMIQSMLDSDVRSTERQARKIKTELVDIILSNLYGKLNDMVQKDDRVSQQLDLIKKGDSDPYKAAEHITGLLLR